MNPVKSTTATASTSEKNPIYAKNPVNPHEPTAAEIAENQLFLAMGMTADEFATVQQILGRLPNYTELGLFSVMWSEHCSYKNSKVLLRKFPTDGARILQGPGEGAGIVDIGDGQAVVFKMESHNHPSAVEPFQGAATGVGGIIRDVFSMGARPVAILNSLRFGELASDRVKYLFHEVVAGIAAYGNCVGIPTIGGEIYFDDCYEGNPLVNAMCVGIIRHSEIQKGQAHGEGNTVMYVGADTGRDGIHGATFASEELTEQSEKKRPSVQVGDPFMEKLLIEACLEVIHNPALVGIQDMGAAGLISSSSEMASKAGMGILLNLDDIPQRETNMTAYEMMLSESQERMLMVVKKGEEHTISAIFEKYGLHAVAVGEVTADKMVRIVHKGQLMADVPADALASQAPEYRRPSAEPDRDMVTVAVDSIADCNATLLALLAQPTLASKHWVFEQYDHQVRTNTAVLPGSDGAVIRIRGTKKALTMTTDCNSRYVYLDPFTGGQIAVAEAARNIVASGGQPLAITDCLNFGSPENPEIFWQMEQAVEGLSAACRALKTPVISGNVSLYNERGVAGEKSAIFPTPAVGMVGLIDDISHITTQFFKNAGDLIYLIGETKAEFGGSELQKLQRTAKEISENEKKSRKLIKFEKFVGMPPSIDMKIEKLHQDFVLQAIQAGLVESAHDVSEGGIAVALAECLFSDKLENLGNFENFENSEKILGAEVNLQMPAENIFSESQSRFILSISPKNQEKFEKMIHTTALQAERIGRVTDGGRLAIFGNVDISVAECWRQWKGAISCLLK